MPGRVPNDTKEFPMSDDPRCCGSGTCIIDSEGRCWCGQQWDGQRMSPAPLVRTAATAREALAPKPLTPAGGEA